MSATLLRPTSYAAAPSTASNRTSASRPSRRAIVTGRVLSGIAAVLLTLDAGVKLAMAKPAIEGSAQLGFSPQQVFVIGVIAAVCLVLYLIPRTAPLGAVLWTGYFGGAIVTHFRLGNPLLTHVLSPIYISAIIWGGLYLRDPRVRAVLGRR
jgi:hypothetical protein